MILLGIETATELVGAAVAVDGEVRASIEVVGRRRHAEVLAPAVAQVLDHAGTSLQALDLIAVDVGPGLFTGLRVGVAMAKGLAQGLGIGVVAVSSLDALAEAAAAVWPGPVLAVVDARRGEVFAARYERAGDGRLVAVAPPALWRPEALVATVAAGPGDPLLAVGDGARRYRAGLGAVPGVSVAGDALETSVPSVLVGLAAARVGRGTALLTPAEVEPVYLREADARINWTQRSPVAP